MWWGIRCWRNKMWFSTPNIGKYIEDISCLCISFYIKLPRKMCKMLHKLVRKMCRVWRYLLGKMWNDYGIWCEGCCIRIAYIWCKAQCIIYQHNHNYNIIQANTTLGDARRDENLKIEIEFWNRNLNTPHHIG